MQVVPDDGGLCGVPAKPFTYQRHHEDPNRTYLNMEVVLYIEQADENGRDGGAYHESCRTMVLLLVEAVFVASQRTFCHERMFKGHSCTTATVREGGMT